MTIALNILSVPHNKETINLEYKSKYNRKCENQVILLIITNSEKWHYIALKSDHGFNRPIRSLSRLFRVLHRIIMEIFTVWVVYIHFEQIMHLKT